MSQPISPTTAAHTASIPTNDGTLTLTFSAGTSTMFVGANGGGKTRLAVHLEKSLGVSAHRISAHRALTLNPAVNKISEKEALNGLRFGRTSDDAALHFRSGSRWHGREPTALLNDFDLLVQALFAEQTNKSLVTHRRHRAGEQFVAERTNFERLLDAWSRLLPHRQLLVSGDDIRVTAGEGTTPYSAAEMSDGERAVFYMVGQALTAAPNSVLIVDEPELHIHRAIMARLWDELEAARSDCAFVYITHDLDFAAARAGQKFVISAYDHKPSWTINPVPSGTGFSEELTTLILGSRKPVLFVEGDGHSLDIALYRACFPAFTIIPRGACDEVVRSVGAMRRNKEFTRITCAGIVDADGYDSNERTALAEKGVAVLTVSEIENLFALPAVARAILQYEQFEGVVLDQKLDELSRAIFARFGKHDDIEAAALRYARRRIDRALKNVDLSIADKETLLAAELGRQVSAIDIAALVQQRRADITTSIEEGDLPTFLALVDNKGILAATGEALRGMKKVPFEAWLTRMLAGQGLQALVDAVRAVLPQVEPK